MLTQKTVLITGAAGFIGSHLVQALLEADNTVIGVDSFLSGRRENLAQVRDHHRFTFIEADVTSPADQYLPDSFVSGKDKIDVVLHFASPASPPRYQAHPVETYLVNSLGTHQLCRFMLEHNPEGTLLFASTSEVYGDPKEHPQAESYWGNVNPNGARSCYDEAKRLGETICGVHFRDFKLDTRIVRIFNTYGPNMDPEDGRVIPNFVTQIIKNEPITMYGDGQQTRSYCYVSDLVAGILGFASRSGLAGQTINLGNPEEKTVYQTAQEIYRYIHDSDLPESLLRFLPLPSDDPLQRRPDTTKAQELLDWQPQVSFQDGLPQTVAYFKEVLSR